MNAAASSRVAATRPAATLALAALTATTAIGMSRLFADWSYLRPVLVVVLGAHALAWALRVARTPAWAALPLLAIGAGELLALTFYRDTLAWPLPTGRTIATLRVDASVVMDQFATAVAPVPSTGSFAAAAAVALVMAVILSDTFAFRALGRVEATVPSGVLFVLTAALGVDRDRVLYTACWLAAAVLVVALLRFDTQDGDASWMGARRVGLAAAFPAIALTAGLGAVAAAAVGPYLPGAGEKGLVDTRNRRSTVTEVVSPLVDIRATLVNRGKVEMFTVAPSDGQGHYMRLIGLPNFDGNAWTPPEEALVEMGDRSSEVLVSSRSVEQRITITGMRGPLVPATFRATQVSPSAVYWAADSESLVLPDGDSLQEGDQILVRSMVPDLSVDELRSAGVSGAVPLYYELPSDIPAVVVATAVEVTAGAATPYDQVMALQQWFQSSFVYDANVQLGNSTTAIEAFLRDRRGFCQQFSGTFAVMARTLGIPARVAVGFTPGDLGADGKFHVFGRHAHAWPEVWFDGIGWVPFEPTPGRGSSDSQDYTGVDPGQDTSTPTPQQPGTQTPATSVAPRPVDGNGNGTGQRPTATTVPAPAAASRSTSDSVPAWMWWLAAALAAVAIWAAVAPWLLRRWYGRHTGNERDRVITAWYRACGAMELIGATRAAGATPAEFAIASEYSVPIDARPVRDLAERVTTVVYAEREVDPAVAADSERLSNLVMTLCHDVAPWGVRARMRLDPRVMRRLATG